MGSKEADGEDGAEVWSHSGVDQDKEYLEAGDSSEDLHNRHGKWNVHEGCHTCFDQNSMQNKYC